MRAGAEEGAGKRREGRDGGALPGGRSGCSLRRSSVRGRGLDSGKEPAASDYS